MDPADRREVDASRTLRPGALTGGLEALPTVADALADASFVAGEPSVVAGRGGLTNRVRWVHASDNPDVARFFAGGELLLSTGQGWAADDAALAAMAEGLAAAGVAGVVLELGTRFVAPPVGLVAAAERLGLPLAVLRREVRFVDLTEAIHRRIIGAQTEALRAGAEVRERFTGLALRGAPADFVVTELARTLGAGVVLENLAHEVIASDFPVGGDGVLSEWSRASRAAAAGAEGWAVVSVDARGTVWGRLVALPGPAHPAGRLAVLEQGAIALALGRLADGGADEWAALARRRLLGGLIEGRFATAADAEARLEAAGLPVVGRGLYGFVVSGGASAAEVERAATVVGGASAAEVERAATVVGGVARAWDAAGVGAVGLVSLPAGRALDDASAGAWVRSAGGGATLTLGRAAAGVDEALASLRDAMDHAGDRGGGRVRWANERPLAQLMNSLRDDHRLVEHGERMLAPLVEYDARHAGDLLEVLGAMLAHPGNRTAAAKGSHLSRSVFYQRLSLIASLLEADLDDGETQTALHVALLARRGA